MLTFEKITELAGLPGVDAEAVFGFLYTLEDVSQSVALANLELDTRSCGWNTQTARAIQTGIMLRGEVRP
jgi:hypothetical protein